MTVSERRHLVNELTECVFPILESDKICGKYQMFKCFDDCVCSHHKSRESAQWILLEKIILALLRKIGHVETDNVYSGKITFQLGQMCCICKNSKSIPPCDTGCVKDCLNDVFVPWTGNIFCLGSSLKINKLRVKSETSHVNFTCFDNLLGNFYLVGNAIKKINSVICGSEQSFFEISLHEICKTFFNMTMLKLSRDTTSTEPGEIDAKFFFSNCSDNSKKMFTVLACEIVFQKQCRFDAFFSGMSIEEIVEFLDTDYMSQNPVIIPRMMLLAFQELTESTELYQHLLRGNMQQTTTDKLKPCYYLFNEFASHIHPTLIRTFLLSLPLKNPIGKIGYSYFVDPMVFIVHAAIALLYMPGILEMHEYNHLYESTLKPLLCISLDQWPCQFGRNNANIKSSYKKTIDDIVTEKIDQFLRNQELTLNVKCARPQIKLEAVSESQTTEKIISLEEYLNEFTSEPIAESTAEP